MTTTSTAARSSSSSSLILSLLSSIGLDHSLSYLHPSDLLALSLTCHQLHAAILSPTALLQLCSLHYVPLQLGLTTNYLVELGNSCSFSCKRELVDYVLDRLHSSHLLVNETTSLQESEERARQLFLLEHKPTVMFHSTTTHGITSSNNNALAECHYQSHVTNTSATAWIDYILNRDACKRYGKDAITNKLIRDWLLLILSSLQQSNDNDENNVQIWRWGCKHGNLSGGGRGVSGVGVMISTTLADGEDEVRCLELELCLTRLY